jgi:hypothetical protein
VCSCGGKDIFHSIEFALKLEKRFVREEFIISHNINKKMKTATTEITLPKEDKAFQANKGSG